MKKLADEAIIAATVTILTDPGHGDSKTKTSKGLGMETDQAEQLNALFKVFSKSIISSSHN